MLLRLSKVVLVLSVAFYLRLVVFGNLTDYETNFRFVEGVMSMSTVVPHNQEMWRAITAPWAHHMLYALIIVWEAAAGVTCWLAAIRMLRSVRRANAFRTATGLAGAGLTLVLLLWFVAFTAVGGNGF